MQKNRQRPFSINALRSTQSKKQKKAAAAAAAKQRRQIQELENLRPGKSLRGLAHVHDQTKENELPVRGEGGREVSKW